MRLIRNVIVHDDAGQPHDFGPGDTVPEWAVERITFPGVWADGPDPGGAPAADGEEVGDGTPAEGPADGAASSGDEVVERPPAKGPGSGLGAWRAYARAIDVPVSDDMSRDDIIAAVDAQDG